MHSEEIAAVYPICNAAVVSIRRCNAKKSNHQSRVLWCEFIAATSERDASSSAWSSKWVSRETRPLQRSTNYGRSSGAMRLRLSGKCEACFPARTTRTNNNRDYKPAHLLFLVKRGPISIYARDLNHGGQDVFAYEGRSSVPYWCILHVWW